MDHEEIRNHQENDAGALFTAIEAQERERVADASDAASRQRAIKVLKFGGTSLAGAGRILRAAHLAQHATDEHRIAVVVSAMRGVTDQLDSIARHLFRGAGGVAFAEAGLLVHQHHETARDLNLKPRDAIRLHTELESLGGELFVSLRAHRHGNGGGEALDQILSFGERFSCRLFTAALRKLGVTATSVDASEFLVTSADFRNAQPLFESTAARAKEVFSTLFAEEVLPVITGFIGATSDGRTTTLGRNSSDYSGAIVAHVLEASELVIWTDVDGLYTANPRVTSSAKLLRALSYERAQALAASGAKVLHPGVIPLAEKTLMRISICNTLNPRAPGTRIGPLGDGESS